MRKALSVKEVQRGRQLGLALKEQRGSRSSTEISTRAGVSVDTLRKLEQGRIPTPGFFVIASLADVLGTTLETLNEACRQEKKTNVNDH